jgi:hypothetical protein
VHFKRIENISAAVISERCIGDGLNKVPDKRIAVIGVGVSCPRGTCCIGSDIGVSTAYIVAQVLFDRYGRILFRDPYSLNVLICDCLSMGKQHPECDRNIRMVGIDKLQRWR